MNIIQIRTALKAFDIHPPLRTSKGALLEMLETAQVGRRAGGFDREARDALHRNPVMLFEHPAGARNRHRRRWSAYKKDGVWHEKLIKRQWRTKPRMVPATARDLRDARMALLRRSAA